MDLLPKYNLFLRMVLELKLDWFTRVSSRMAAENGKLETMTPKFF